jgi:hypothetical protein
MLAGIAGEHFFERTNVNPCFPRGDIRLYLRSIPNWDFLTSQESVSLTQRTTLVALSA